MSSDTGNISGTGGNLPLPPPRERTIRKGPLRKPGVEIGGSERAAKAAKSAGLPVKGPGQSEPIPAPRPAPLSGGALRELDIQRDYHQEPISQEKRQMMNTLRGYLMTHPESLAVEGIGRLPGEGPVVRKLLENPHATKDKLAQEKHPGTDFFHSVAAAFVKAFDGIRPFSAKGYHLMLEAGDNKSFPSDEVRATKLKQAIDELPETDKRTLKGLVDFMVEIEKAQKALPEDKSMNIQKVAMAVAPNLIANTDLKLLIKHTKQMEEALILLAKHRDFVFEGKPFTATEAPENIPSAPRRERPKGIGPGR